MFNQSWSELVRIGEFVAKKLSSTKAIKLNDFSSEKCLFLSFKNSFNFVLTEVNDLSKMMMMKMTHDDDWHIIRVTKVSN